MNNMYGIIIQVFAKICQYAGLLVSIMFHERDSFLFTHGDISVISSFGVILPHLCHVIWGWEMYLPCSKPRYAKWCWIAMVTLPVQCHVTGLREVYPPCPTPCHVTRRQIAMATHLLRAGAQRLFPYPLKKSHP